MYHQVINDKFVFEIKKKVVAFNGTLNVGNENDEHDGTLAIIFINFFFSVQR